MKATEATILTETMVAMGNRETTTIESMRTEGTKESQEIIMGNSIIFLLGSILIRLLI